MLDCPVKDFAVDVAHNDGMIIPFLPNPNRDEVRGASISQYWLKVAPSNLEFHCLDLRTVKDGRHIPLGAKLLDFLSCHCSWFRNKPIIGHDSLLKKY
jgi:hypothetical protein